LQKILFTIPNFHTAGSGLALLSIVKKIDRKKFIPEIACLHEKGELYKEVKKTGIKIHIIDLYKRPRPIYFMLYDCYLLSTIFKNIGADLIHSYNYSSDYTEAIAARIAGIKWIYTKKNMSWDGPSIRSWRLRSYLANYIIIQNRDMKRFFSSFKNKIRLIPIGVNSQSYQKKDGRPLFKKNKIRRLITVSNLTSIKGTDIIIRAFRKIHEEFDNWNLVVVGDDTTKYGVYCKNLVQSYSMDRKIIFTGKILNVNDYLSASEIFVLASLEKGEGAPIAILEAMANEKNVIASDVPGIRDQMNPFKKHLFSPGNIDNLCEKLIFYMGLSTRENKKIGKIFSKYVNNYYHIDNEVHQLEKLYLELLKSNSLF